MDLIYGLFNCIYESDKDVTVRCIFMKRLVSKVAAEIISLQSLTCAGICTLLASGDKVPETNLMHGI